MSNAPFDPSAAAPEGAGIFGLDTPAEQAHVVFLPVPFDATTSYGHGTAAGPAAILQASHQVELYDVQLGKPYERGMAMLPISERVASLNQRASDAIARAASQGADAQAAAVAAVNDASAEVNQFVFDTCQHWLSRGKIVATVGGDHATPLGAILAYAEHYPKLSVLHIDAHCDLRRAYEGFTYSHASIMYNVMFLPKLHPNGPAHAMPNKLVQVGVRDFCEPEHRLVTGSGGRIVTFFDHELAERAMEGEPFARTAGAIVDTLGDEVYVSLDIDGLEPAFGPHTGTPVPGGLHYRQMLALLRALHQSGRRLVGFDLNEVCPGPSGDEWDANVGARLLYKMAGYALLGETPRRPRGQAAGFF